MAKPLLVALRPGALFLGGWGLRGRGRSRCALAPQTGQPISQQPTKASHPPPLKPQAADVFSFGVVLWELLTWQEPWGGANAFQVGSNHWGLGPALAFLALMPSVRFEGGVGSFCPLPVALYFSRGFSCLDALTIWV